MKQIGIRIILVFITIGLVSPTNITYSFVSYCTYEERSVELDTKYYVTYNGETLSGSPCRMGFKSSDKRYETCATAEDFNLNCGGSYIEIYSHRDNKKTWRCGDSPTEVCAAVDEVLKLDFYNGNSSPGGNFRFKVYIDNETSLETIIIILVCIGIAGIGGAVFLAIYCKVCKRNQNKTGTVANTRNTHNTGGRNFTQNYGYSNQGQGGLTQQYSSAYNQQVPATQNSYGFQQPNQIQSGLTQPYASAFTQQQAPPTQNVYGQPGYGQGGPTQPFPPAFSQQQPPAPINNYGYGQQNSGMIDTNNYGTKEQPPFSYEQNESGVVPSAPTYDPPPAPLSQPMY